MGLRFEWDPRKAKANLRKHGVSFDEASSAFGDTLSTTILDPVHSGEEERFVLRGHSLGGRLLVVAHVVRGGRIRIISARLAQKRERTEHEANAQ